MNFFVYYLLCPTTGDILYIGRSNKPRLRHKHFERKHGLPVNMGLLQRHSTFEAACDAEIAAIVKHHPKYNKHLVSSTGALGRKNAKGYKHTPEAKVRILKAVTGRRQSSETCQLKSDIQKGDKAHWFGKKFSEATKDKMRKSAQLAWLKRRKHEIPVSCHN